MSNQSPIEFVRETHSHLNTYITSADQKSSILLTAQFAFLGLFGNALKEGWGTTTGAFKIFAVLTVITGLIGIAFAGLVVYPRSPKGDEEGLMFWESIQGREESKFVEEIRSLDEEGILEEQIKQNYSLAKVADSKYRYTRLSLISTGLMVLLAVISAAVYFGGFS